MATREESQANVVRGLEVIIKALLTAVMSLSIDAFIIMLCVNTLRPATITFWQTVLLIIAVRTILPKSTSTLDRITAVSTEQEDQRIRK